MTGGAADSGEHLALNWFSSCLTFDTFNYELLTTFLGAVAAPLLISDSDFGSGVNCLSALGTILVPALHPCITYAFLHEKHSKLKSIIRVQIASCFLHWNTRDIARSRFAGETPA